MDFRKLHPWNLTPRQAVALQNRLRSRLELVPPRGPLRRIAGADISYERFSDLAHAAFVVLELPDLKIIARSHATARMTFPYVPGLLTFREAPALLNAWSRLALEPDVVMFDGMGIAHPRRMGIAAHLGLLLDKPAIGCGKSRLFGAHDEPGMRAGSWKPLRDGGETIGAVLRTRDGINPIYVSPGHHMDLKTAIQLTMACVGRYRIPEPTRQAHLYANELRRNYRLAA